MNWNRNNDGMTTKSYEAGFYAEFDVNSTDDPDVYDDLGEVNDPSSPVWDGSDVQSDLWGEDPVDSY